jgi:KDO2-lipid IV(A) lauroyltransferase
VVRGVWDNLGRTVAELPHVPTLRPTESGPGWELRDAGGVLPLLAAGGPAVLIGGHLANWEIWSRVASQQGIALAPFYRPVRNPYIDRLLHDLRQQTRDRPGPAFAKGAEGARAALAYLRAGGVVGLLVDQKMNDGIEARLFGMPAMTASAAAAFALRFRCPLIPANAERLGPARFRVVWDPPLPLPDTGQRMADIAVLTQLINDRLETWIRARPAEWLWLHRRWPKAA